MGTKILKCDWLETHTADIEDAYDGPQLATALEVLNTFATEGWDAPQSTFESLCDGLCFVAYTMGECYFITVTVGGGLKLWSAGEPTVEYTDVNKMIQDMY